MIIAPLIINFFVCTIILYNDVVLNRFKRFASSVFLCFFYLLFVIVPLILHSFFSGARSIVAGKQDVYFDSIVYHVMNVYTLMIVFSFVAYRVWVSRLKKELFTYSFKTNLADDFTSKLTRNYFLFFVIGSCILVGTVLFFFSTGMSLAELLAGSRFGWFSNPSAFIVGIAISHYFFSVAPLNVFIFLQLKNNLFSIGIFLIFISGLALYGVVSQDRKWIIYIFSGVVAHLYVKNRKSLPISMKFLSFSIIILVLLFVSQFIRDFTTRVLLGQADISNFFIELTSWFSFLIEFGDISYFYRASCETIHQTLLHGVIEPLGVLRRNLLFFLPVDLSFGLKPEDLSAIFSDLVKGEDAVRRGNMPPGFFGLLVMSFGVSWPVIMFCFIPFILGYFDKIIYALNTKFSIVLLSSFLSSFLLLMRGDDSSAIYFLVFNYIVFSVTLFFNRFTLSRKIVHG
jgi:hypothetical protein